MPTTCTNWTGKQKLWLVWGTLLQGNWAVIRIFQQCSILTCVDSDQPVQPPVNLRNSKCCSVCSLTIIEYSSDKQRLWSDCAYAQADLRLCWSHIPHCWKSHVAARMTLNNSHFFNVPCREKTCLWDFQSNNAQTSLPDYLDFELKKVLLPP